MTRFLSPEQVLFIHHRLIIETGGESGLRDLPGLLSALARPRATFDQRELYPDLFSKAAALFDSLLRNHPFLDGNKRTAITTTALFLKFNGHTLNAGNEELVDFTLKCAQSQVGLKEIEEWIKENAK